jgi:hypothetical protein
MNEIPIPPELQHLIEKREQSDRRQGMDRRELDLGPLGSVESLEELDLDAVDERRQGDDRRGDSDRRSSSS